MKKSTLWRNVGIAATVLSVFVSIGICLSSSSTSNSSKYGAAAAAKADVNLEKLTKAFEAYAKTGAQDVKGFEPIVNDKSRGIYNGKEKVEVSMSTTGEVIGFVDKDKDGAYKKDKDSKVFSIQAEKNKNNVVASDHHQNHYRYRPSGSGFFTGMLVGHMFTRQRAYYGHHWTAPRTARYVKPGYYNRARSSYRSRSRSRSYGSSGSRSYKSNRSSSSGTRRSSGGFGFGK